MITAAKFYGGAEHHEIAGLVQIVQLHGASPRHQTILATDAGSLYLPTAAGRRPGGPHFVISNLGPEDLTVRAKDGTELRVLAPASTAYVSLLDRADETGWRLLTRTRNAAAAAGRGTRSSIATNPVNTPRTYSPECVDPCSSSITPVEFHWPMWINSCIAQNENREAVRGADLIMASRIEIQVGAGLVEDDAHSHAGPLSQALKDLLYARHVLVFDSIATPSVGSPVRSRHPHHARMFITPGPVCGYSMPSQDGGVGVLVKRGVWKKVISYEVGKTSYELELRLTAECPWDTDLDKPAEGFGAHGTLLNFAAFATEVNPGYVEGDEDPDQADIPFTRDDPLVWGPLYLGATRQKYAHPQALFCAHIPTTFQAPCGSSWIPAGEEQYEACYALTNGAPWSDGVPCESLSNCVFGGEDLDDGYACMTVGGDAPTSEFYPFITIENGAGYGLTALKPTSPGWSEADGDLTSGSDLSLTECAIDQSDAAIDVCIGHPEGMFGGVGGTHRCWKTGGTTIEAALEGGGTKFCCWSLAEGARAIITVTEPCTATIFTCDEFCDFTDVSCSIAMTFTTEYEAKIENYTMRGSRTGSWWVGRGDPDYVPCHWTDTANLPTLNELFGDWSHPEDDTIEVDEDDGGVLGPTALAYFDSTTVCPGHIGYYHVDLECVVHVRAIGWLPNHGLVVHQSPFLADNYQGIGGFWHPHNNKIAIVWFKPDGTTQLLGVEEILLTGVDGNDWRIRFSARGSRFTFTLMHIDGTVLKSLTVDCCVPGLPGVVGLATMRMPAVFPDSLGEGAVFKALTITDHNATGNPGIATGLQLLARVSAAPSPLLGVNVPLKMCGSYIEGGCVNEPTDACTPGNCGQKLLAYQLFQTHSGDTDDINVGPYGAGNPRAEWCAETVVCSGGPPAPRCGDCPGPFAAVTVRMPAGCGTIPAGATLDICPGIEVWHLVELVCDT